MRTRNVPPINQDRLNARIARISEFTRPEMPWTRRAFSPEFERARAWLRDEFQEAGLSVKLDAGGNLVGRREGEKPDLPAIVTGSHCDTVVSGGRFDGILGVIAGLEVAQTLSEAGISMNHPFELIDFLSEEPSDYGVSCVGSRAFSGLLTQEMLALRNPEGETLREGIQRIGGSPAQLHAPLRAEGSTAAFVELHIEQGPVLETCHYPIGIVTNIVGIRRVLIKVSGRPDHAGTTPMHIRRDALVGAAHIVTNASALASRMAENPHYVVATIGRMTISPNVANAVPGEVEMMLEVRSDSAAILESFPESVIRLAESHLLDLRLSASLTLVSHANPTDCQSIVMNAIDAAAKRLGYETNRMPSGAGHDAVYVAPTGPIGMIFVPCLNGRSHCPEEWISSEQLLDGTRVLYETILELDLVTSAPLRSLGIAETVASP